MATHGYKLRFPDPSTLREALAPEEEGRFTLVNLERAYVALPSEGSRMRVVPPPETRQHPMGLSSVDSLVVTRGGGVGDGGTPAFRREPLTPEAEFDRMQVRYSHLIKDFGAELVPDFQYDLEDPDEDAEGDRFTEDEVTAGVAAILAKIGLTPASLRGERATVAIVDTGVDPELALIDAGRQRSGWSWSSQRPAWADTHGHGTRTARIACGADGVATGAQVISCRTRFRDSELALVYDFLRTEVLPTLDGPLIVNNSFGIQSATPPTPDPYGQFEDTLAQGVEAGMFVVFSAGNYHLLAGGRPGSCDPTSIWTYKCRADVMTVGACDLGGAVHDISSRGPGQFPNLTTSGPKPDLCAPVPDERWGTSGAAPQVAGVAAIASARNPGLGAADLRRSITATLRAPGAAVDCAGAGVLDGGAAAAWTPPGP